MNLKLMLENTTKQHAGKIALVLGHRRVTYTELDEASNKVAHALIKMGIEKGDRIAIMLTNSPDFVITYFGIIKTGGIVVLLDTRYKIDELASIFNNCKPKALVTESPFLEPIVSALPRLDCLEHIITLSPGYKGQFHSYQEIIATSSAEEVNIELASDDIAIIAYTSGPTSSPHGAVFSHNTLCTETFMSAEGLQQTDKDVVMLFALPLYHMFGLATALLNSISKGSSVVIVPGTGISIDSLMEAIEREKGTILMGVPYIYALAVKMAKREGIKNDLSSLRLCGSGGAPLTISTIKEFKKYYKITINDWWGLTEAVSQVTYHPIGSIIQLGSSGKALPGWEMKIVDDNDEELPPNTSGEIIVRGPIMRGYYNNPQATAEAIKNGWLHTGDIGRMDRDGYLYITGRKKPMIILKGQNIYPSDIEKVLCTHPKIAEAKVIGIPDRLRGEIVRAIIRLRRKVVATEQEIRYFCQSRMADYKLPRQVIFTKSLIKVTTAKIRQKSPRKYLSRLSPVFRSPHQRKAKS